MKHPYEQLEAKLEYSLRSTMSETFRKQQWQQQSLRSLFPGDETSAKMAVIEAFRDVAQDFQIAHVDQAAERLETHITLDMTPANVVEEMLASMRYGIKCPPGQSPELEVVQEGDTQVWRWVCR